MAELSFYADSVDYFDHGVVNRAFIAQDIQKYVNRWPLRRYRIVGEIRTGVVDQKRDMAGVTFRLRFAVQNDKKAVTGVCDDALLIMDASTRPKIVAIKSTPVSRREVLTSR